MTATQSRYNRVSPRFWSDPAVLGWSDDAKLLALYLLTCEHRTTEGYFRLPKQYMMADLNWSPEQLEEPFGQLLQDGFIEWDPSTSVILIVKALAYQSPQNPNQATGAANAIALLPPNALEKRFRELAEQYSERLVEALPEGFGEPLGELFPPSSSSSDSSSGSSSTPVGNGEPFERRLADELREQHGCTFGQHDKLHDAFQELLATALERLPEDRHHGTVMGLITRFVERATGHPITTEARSHTARLVRTHQPATVLRGFGQAMDWGAGTTPEYADDPTALSKYVAGVLSGKKRGAA